MKKILALMISAILTVFCFAGCNDNTDNTENTETKTNRIEQYYDLFRGL